MTRRLLPALCALAFALTAPSAMAQTVSVGVTGQGSVSGPGIDCTHTGGPDCSEPYPSTRVCEWDAEIKQEFCWNEAQMVDLTAAVGANGYSFSGWTGCDAVATRTCTMTVTGDRSVTAGYVDVATPSVSVSPSSGVRRGTLNLAATASDNSGAIHRVEFRVRGTLVNTDFSAPYGTSFDTTGVADGSAAVRATAFDNAGNSSISEGTITIDNTAPGVSISSGPNNQTFGGSSTQTWTFSASDATSGVQAVHCSVVATGSAPSFGACSGGTGSHSVSGRPEGSYTFSVRVRDGGGLETIASRTFAIDTTPPDTAIDTGPADGSSSTDTNATFGFSASEGGSTFRCRVYLSGITPPEFGACSGDGTHTASGLNPGNYTFEVQATDAYGNADGSPAARSFTVAAPSSGGDGSGAGSGTGTGSTPPPADSGPGGGPTGTPAAAVLAAGPTTARTRLLRALTRGLAVGFTCSKGCAVTAQLRATSGLLAATKVVARGTKTLLTAGTGKVVLKFTRKAKRALANKRSVRLTLVFSVKAADGSVQKVTRRVTLKR